jgi:hypothetical protein
MIFIKNEMLSKLKGRLKYTKNVVDEEVKGKSY